MSELYSHSDANDDGSNELFELLTDALRAGPNSPQWDAAVRRVGNAARLEGNGEYEMLLSARRRLETIRSFGMLSPSQQMTAAVLAGVADQAEAESRNRMRLPRHPPTSKTIAIVAAAAAMVILSIAAVVVESMLRNDADGNAINLPIARVAPAWESFQSNIPGGWRPIGPLRVKPDHGLRLAYGTKHTDQSGGLLRSQAIPAGQPFDLLAAVHYVGAADVTPEVFLTDDPMSDDDHPSGHFREMVWTMSNDVPGLRLPNGEFVGTGPSVPVGKNIAFKIRMSMNKGHTNMQVKAGNFVVCSWSGDSLLAGDKPMHVGVRLNVRGPQASECAAAVDAVRVDLH